MNYISLQNFSEANPFACVCSNRIRIESSKEMELVRLLDQFVDRALWFATEGNEQYIQQQVTRQCGFE